MSRVLQVRHDKLAQIRARGRLPLLVGGTMLYARALLAPFDRLPPADAAIRRRLEREAAEQGWPALHRRLAELDPVSAGRILHQGRPIEGLPAHQRSQHGIGKTGPSLRFD